MNKDNKNTEHDNTDKKLHISDVIQRSFLLNEMINIRQSYKNMEIYYYEIYTLMCGIAMKNNISYNVVIHTELMNVV